MSAGRQGRRGQKANGQDHDRGSHLRILFEAWGARLVFSAAARRALIDTSAAANSFRRLIRGDG
jgi:hypothetical protein